MYITEAVEADFPMFVVQAKRHYHFTKVVNGEFVSTEHWYDFAKPFKTEKEANNHIDYALKECGLKGSLRVGVYTVEQWRDDLISLIRDNEELLEKLLKSMSNAELLKILR